MAFMLYSLCTETIPVVKDLMTLAETLNPFYTNTHQILEQIESNL